MSTDIRQKVLETPLFDDHEHLTPLPELAEEPDSYESFVGYAAADLLVCRGPQAPGSAVFPEEPGSARDRAFFAAWRKARNTSLIAPIKSSLWIQRVGEMSKTSFSLTGVKETITRVCPIWVARPKAACTR